MSWKNPDVWSHLVLTNKQATMEEMRNAQSYMFTFV